MALQTSSRDIPGRKREYETTYILRPETPDAGVSEVNARIRGIIEAQDGVLLKVENWGRRRLAYMVKKNVRGTYLHFCYLGQTGLVEEIERNLRLLDSVIRYYTVKVAENVEPASRTSSVTDESFAEASVAPPDEPEPTSEVEATAESSKESADKEPTATAGGEASETATESSASESETSQEGKEA